MQARLATSPNTGITKWRTTLKLGCLWKHTRQVTQLNPYSKNVPKFEASVTVRKELGRAAILLWVVYPKLDQKPCGSAWIAASGGALPSPKNITTVRQPNIAEIAASVQMARWGVGSFHAGCLNFPIAPGLYPWRK